jgi:ankyrin repeat protein
MIRATLFPGLVALLSANAAAAGINKRVDENGVIHYGDRPPAQVRATKLGDAVAPEPAPVREPANATELDDAVQKRDLERVRELTRDGTEVSQDALRMAAVDNQAQILALLLAARERELASWASSQGSLDYTMSVYRETAMRQAVDADADRVVQFLANEGTQVDQRYGNSYLMDAVRTGSTRIAKILLDAGADVDQKYGFAIRHATGAGDVAMVKLLIDAGANLDAQSWGQNPPGPPIKDATIRGHTEVVKLLKLLGAKQP